MTSRLLSWIMKPIGVYFQGKELAPLDFASTGANAQKIFLTFSAYLRTFIF